MNNLAIKGRPPYDRLVQSSQSGLVSDIRSLALPATPIVPELPKSFEPLLLRSMPGPVRAILFDIYGTLFLSATGDIGVETDDRNVLGAGRAYARVFGTPLDASQATEIARRFRQYILESHEMSRSGGETDPEVEIRDIWRRTLTSMNLVDEPLSTAQVERFAVIFEIEANPVWPMPGAGRLLRDLRGRLPLGIVSNAQFHTELLFPAFFDKPLEALGFDRRCCAFSYREGRAKPDIRLFGPPLAALAEQGIDSSEVVYVGNDMLNDAMTARRAGCMTVLFAGDERSLRLRPNHPEAGRQRPDSVIHTLDQIAFLAGVQKESA